MLILGIADMFRRALTRLAASRSAKRRRRSARPLAADVETLGDLVSYNKSDLLKFRNFGKKSLTELEELVRIKNLNFGMPVEKYGITPKKN